MTPLEHDLLHYWPEAAGFGRVGMRVINHLDRPGYHGQAHVLTVLDRADELASAVRVRGFNLVALRLAAFFHDYVYDGVHGQDEEESAKAATELLGRYSSLSDGEIGRVAELIMVTKDHDPAPGDRLAGIISDADLWILSSPPHEYMRYAAAVREEYAAVSDQDFARGRHEVLQKLGEGGVYSTETARERWEHAARVNIAMELTWLQVAYGL